MNSTIKPLTYGECSDGEMYIQEVDDPITQVGYVLNNGNFNKTLALAQLFAAAPDLLDALRQLAWAEAHGDDIELANARKARDAAISKATGEK